MMITIIQQLTIISTIQQQTIGTPTTTKQTYIQILHQQQTIIQSMNANTNNNKKLL